MLDLSVVHQSSAAPPCTNSLGAARPSHSWVAVQHCELTIVSVDVCPRAGHQHVLDVVQVAVVDLWPDAQDVAHERVDVDRLEGLHHQVPVEGRTHGSEEGLHVHLLVVVAVLTFVELHWKILWETCRRCIM